MARPKKVLDGEESELDAHKRMNAEWQKENEDQRQRLALAHAQITEMSAKIRDMTLIAQIQANQLSTIRQLVSLAVS